MFNEQVILITGGTSSFGENFTKTLFGRYSLKKLIISSRDELKQFEMARPHSSSCMRYFIGDVRDFNLARVHQKKKSYISPVLK
jgi:UDP-N-acetylglucosamine 4,6-dehydratase/5-epimerase